MEKEFLANNQKAIFEMASEDVNRPDSQILNGPTVFTTQPEGMVSQPTISSEKIEVAIPSEGVSVRPYLSLRPMNELLEVPLDPLVSFSGEQSKKRKKSPCKLQVESKLTNDSVKSKSNVQIKVVPVSDKNKLKVIESNSNQASSSSENDNSLLKDGIIMDDDEVDRMDLNQVLDKAFQYKDNLLDNFRNQIFVGNLPPSIKKLHVSKFFERYGRILDLTLIRSKSLKTVICFITYKETKSVRDSLETNGIVYLGRNLRVSRVGRGRVIVDSTIVVTNLPEGTTNQDLYNLFETCGLIKSPYLVKENGKLLAYVTFELKVSASYALLLKNFVLRGRQLNLHAYTNQREKQGLSKYIV